MSIPTVVEILDVNLNVITPIKGLKPIDKTGVVLKYSKELSDYGKCTFRLNTNDPVFVTYGDIFVPHKNHIRLRKGTTTIWQGAIVNNPKRNKDFLEVVAAEYEFYLSKKLVHRTSPDINGTTDIFRIFKSGTMAEAVTAIMNETISDYAASNHALKTMTLGTVENPDYPKGLTSDFNGSPLTGPWIFGEGTSTAMGPQLTYDYISVLYVLKSFGMYAYADFEINESMQFNFKKFLGNNLTTNLVFSYGQQGNIVDYNLPRLGERQINSAIAIATDPNGVMLHANKIDDASVKTYGLLEAVAAYNDVKGLGTLSQRIGAELPFVATPDESNAMIYLNEHGYPLGQYDVGDLITLTVKDASIDFKQVRRVVGYTVLQHETGRESIALQTNKPYAWQYPNQ